MFSEHTYTDCTFYPLRFLPISVYQLGGMEDKTVFPYAERDGAFVAVPERALYS